MQPIADKLNAVNIEVDRAFSEFLPLMADRLLEDQRLRMLTRTAAGVDFEGNEFAPYRPLTRKIRRERGLQTSRVNLRFDNIMLNSIKPMFDLTLFEGVLSSLVFGGDSFNEEKAFRIQEGVGMMPRRFFDVSDRDEFETEKVVEVLTDNFIDGL